MIGKFQKLLKRKVLLAAALGIAGVGIWGADSVEAAVTDVVIDDGNVTVGHEILAGKVKDDSDPVNEYKSNGGVELGVEMPDGTTTSKAGDLVLDGKLGSGFDVVAGVHSDKAPANGGHVIIIDGTYGTVYGGHGKDSGTVAIPTQYNVVDIKGNNIIIGGLYGGNDAKTFEGNTLNVDGHFTADKVERFETINFIDKNSTYDASNPNMTVQDPLYLSDVYVKTISVDIYDDKLKNGVYRLATANGQDGIVTPDPLSLTYIINIDGNKKAEATGRIAEISIAPIAKPGYVKSVGGVKLGLVDSNNNFSADNSAANPDVDSIAFEIFGGNVLAGKIIESDSTTTESKEGVTLPDGKTSAAGDLVLDGKQNADIVAGVYTNKPNANENGTNIYIQDGTYDKVYGVYVSNLAGQVSPTADNTKVFWRKGSINDTLAVAGGQAVDGSNNTLTVYDEEGKSVGTLKEFNEYVFVMENDPTGKTMLEVTGNDKLILDDTTVSVDIEKNISDALKSGVYYLATVNGGIQAGNTIYIIQIDGKDVARSDGSGAAAKYTATPIANIGHVKSLGEIELEAINSNTKARANGSGAIVLRVDDETKLAGRMTTSDGKTTKSIKGAESIEGDLVLDGKETADIIAGVYTAAPAKMTDGTNIYIEGGNYDEVYGVYSTGGTEANNTNVSWRKGSVRTLDVAGGQANVGSKNTLTVYDEAGGKSINNLNGFDNFKFMLNENTEATTPALTVNNKLEFGKVKTVEVDMNDAAFDKIKDGVYYVAKTAGIDNATDATKYALKRNGTAVSGAINIEEAGHAKHLGKLELGLADSNGDKANDSIAINVTGDNVLAGKLTVGGEDASSKGGVVLADGTETIKYDLVLDGKEDANIIAGVYTDAPAAQTDGTNIYIEGGTYDKVYGVYSTDDTKAKNTNVSWRGGSINDTLAVGNDKVEAGSDNSLTVYGGSAGKVVNNLDGFNNYKFVLDENTNAVVPVLTVNNTLDFEKVKNVAVDMDDAVFDNIKDVYYVAKADGGINNATDATAYNLTKNGTPVDKAINIQEKGHVKQIGGLELGLAESKGNGVDSVAIKVTGESILAGTLTVDGKPAQYSEGDVEKVGDGKTTSKPGDLVLDGAENANIIAGVYTDAPAAQTDGTHIYIEGGKYGEVYGVYSTDDTEANDTNVSWRDGSVDTLAVGNEKVTVGDNNSLTVYGGKTAKSVDNLNGFDNYKFVLDENTNDAEQVLKVEKTLDFQKVHTVAVDVDNAVLDKIKDGVYYVATTGGINDDGQITTEYLINGEKAGEAINQLEQGHVKHFGKVDLGLANSNDGKDAKIQKDGTGASVDSIAIGISGENVLAGQLTVAGELTQSSIGGVEKVGDGKTTSKPGDLVLDGKEDADIIAGVYTEGSAPIVDDVNIYIQGGTYENSVYGVYSKNAQVTANKTNVSWRDGSVDTIAVGNEKVKDGDNDSLTVYDGEKSKSVGKLSGFDNYAFVMEKAPVADETMLQVTGNEELDLDNATVSVDMKKTIADNMKSGVYYLAKANGGIQADATDYIIKIDGKDVAKSDVSGDTAKYTIAPKVHKGYVKSFGEIELGAVNSKAKASRSIAGLDSIALMVDDETKLAGRMIKSDGTTESDAGAILADGNTSGVGDLVLDGKENANIIAGVYTEDSKDNVKGTNIYIQGDIDNNVHGVYSKNVEANANDTKVSWWTGSINGTLAVAGGQAKDGSNNSLTIYGGAEGKSVKNLSGFDKYAFVVDKNTATDQPLLTVKDQITMPGEVDVDLQLVSDDDLVRKLSNTDRVTLLGTTGLDTTTKTFNGIGETTSVENLAFILDVKLDKNDNDIYADIARSLNWKSKSLAEIQLGSSIAVNNALNMTSDEGMRYASDAAVETEEVGKYTPFFNMIGGKTRTETGSYIDAKGTSLMAGFSRRMDLNNGYMLNGMFVEYGNYSLESHVRDMVADGKSMYYGLGWLGKRVMDNNVYVEGSAHIGKVHSDYDGDNKNYAPAHSSSSTYAAMHLGVGKTFQTSENSSWNVYTKYFFSHVGGADYNLRGYDVSLGAVNAHRLALGTRWDMKMNDKSSIYADVAVNRTFTGDQNGTLHGYSLDAPTLKGTYGMFKLGTKLQLSTSTELDLGVRAYVGDTRGVMGNVGINFSF